MHCEVRHEEMLMEFFNQESPTAQPPGLSIVERINRYLTCWLNFWESLLHWSTKFFNFHFSQQDHSLLHEFSGGLMKINGNRGGRIYPKVDGNNRHPARQASTHPLLRTSKRQRHKLVFLFFFFRASVIHVRPVKCTYSNATFLFLSALFCLPTNKDIIHVS